MTSRSLERLFELLSADNSLSSFAAERRVRDDVLRNSSFVHVPISQLAPISGWCLDPLAVLDCFEPGLLADSLVFDARRRQAVFAYLSTATHLLPVHRLAADSAVDQVRNAFSLTLDEDAASRVANMVGRAIPAELIESAFGGSSELFLDHLAQVGRSPEPPSFYRRLWSLHREDRSSFKLAALEPPLRCMGAETLDIVDALHPVLRVPGITVKLNAGEAASLTEALPLIRLLCSAATEDELRRSASVADSAAEFILGWLRRADPVAPPFLPASWMRPLQTWADIEEADVRYGHSIKRYSIGLLQQRHYFYEVCIGNGAIVHLERTVQYDWYVRSLREPKGDAALSPELDTSKNPTFAIGQWRVVATFLFACFDWRLVRSVCGLRPQAPAIPAVLVSHSVRFML